MPTDASLLTTRQYEKTQFVRCYTIGHAWFDYDNSDWQPEWGDPLVLRCERCGSERRDTVGATGAIVGRSYFHPDGYKYDKGTRPTKDEFRRAMLDMKRREGGTRRRPRKRKVS